MYNIGIDLGGTNIKVGVVNENYEIIGRSSVRTNMPRPAEEIVLSIADAVELACKDAGIQLSNVESIGIGTPGAASRKTGKVLYANNLGFYDFDLGSLLGAKIGKDIYVENDANAAAYGEVLAGAGKDYKNVVVITLGTGVGGGVIIDGQIYNGFNSCAGELGHTVIEYGGVPCSCGRKGCFEAYSSATGLIRMTREAMLFDKASEMWSIAGGSIDNVDGKTAFDGMRRNDASGKAVVEKYIEYLGCGLSNIINIFQPELLLIGGGICMEGDNLTVPLREIIKRESYCIDGAPTTELSIAKLGNDAGIIGAAFLGDLS